MTATGTSDVHVKVSLGLDGDVGGNPLKVISGITQGIKTIERQLRDSVAQAREQGVSWEQIGKALGVSRQAAWERFSTD
jgi:hypothetical protein